MREGGEGLVGGGPSVRSMFSTLHGQSHDSDHDADLSVYPRHMPGVVLMASVTDVVCDYGTFYSSPAEVLKLDGSFIPMARHGVVLQRGLQHSLP